MNKSLIISSVLSTIGLIGVFIIYGKLLDLLKCKVSGKLGGFFALFTFIGIIHHELSHALFALVTGAKVNSIVLFRLKAKKGVLGEVKFTPRGLLPFRSLQVALTSLAPMIMGTLTLALGLIFINPVLNSWYLALAIYLEVTILLHMSLSNQDIKNVLKNIIWVLLLVFSLFYFSGYTLLDVFSKVKFLFSSISF